MQPVAHEAAEQDAEQREYDVFAIHIGRDLAVVKAQQLDGGKLALALSDVDVRKVKEHDHRQRRRCQNDDDHNEVHALHAVHVGILRVAHARGRRHAAHVEQLFKNGVAGVGIVAREVQKVGVRLAVGVERIFIVAGRHIDEVARIVLVDARDRHIAAHVAVEEEGVAHRDLQKLGELLVDVYALIAHCDGISALVVEKVHDLADLVGGHHLDIGGG